jgi:uncharacterized RDD family membrane protein YckC
MAVTYEDRISIPTPEGVELELVLAGLGSRLLAALADTLVQGAVLFALVLLGAGAGLTGDTAGGIFQMLLVVAMFLTLFGYHVIFETLASGRTPGKRWAGLRVVRQGGEPPGFLAAVVRNLLRLIDMIPGFYAVGALAVLLTRRHQRLGDLAAGTLVVRERRAPLLALSATDDWAAADRYAAWDVSGITQSEVATVRRFLERRAGLDPAARLRLARELTSRLRPRVPGAPDWSSDEEFLQALAAAKAARS